jgi:hypothetical protein
MRRPFNRWAILVGAIALGALAYLTIGGQLGDPLRKFYGEQPVDAVEHATAVRAWRLKPLDRSTGHALPPMSQIFASEYETSGSDVVAPADWLARFKRHYLDPKNHTLQRTSACGPEYGVLLRFEGPKGAAYLPICFKCAQVTLAGGRGQGRIEELPGAMGPWIDFVTELFPNDPEILALSKPRPHKSP